MTIGVYLRNRFQAERSDEDLALLQLTAAVAGKTAFFYEPARCLHVDSVFAGITPIVDVVADGVEAGVLAQVATEARELMTALGAPATGATTLCLRLRSGDRWAVAWPAYHPFASRRLAQCLRGCLLEAGCTEVTAGFCFTPWGEAYASLYRWWPTTWLELVVPEGLLQQDFPSTQLARLITEAVYRWRGGQGSWQTSAFEPDWLPSAHAWRAPQEETAPEEEPAALPVLDERPSESQPQEPELMTGAVFLEQEPEPESKAESEPEADAPEPVPAPRAARPRVHVFAIDRTALREAEDSIAVPVVPSYFTIPKANPAPSWRSVTSVSSFVPAGDAGGRRAFG